MWMGELGEEQGRRMKNRKNQERMEEGEGKGKKERRRQNKGDD